MTEIRFLRNSGETFNVVFDSDPNVALDQESLIAASGGYDTDEAFYAAGKSTFSTLPLTLSTLSSVKD